MASSLQGVVRTIACACALLAGSSALFLSSGRAIGQQSARAELDDEARAEALAERDRLWEVAQDHAKAGRMPDAIDTLRKVAAIERRVLGGQSSDYATSLDWLAHWLVQIEDFPAARKAREGQVAILEKVLPEGDWRTADARWSLKQIDVLARLSPDERRELASVADNFAKGSAAYQQGDVATAIRFAQEELAVYERILADPHPLLATAIGNLGYLINAQGDAVAARPYYECSAAMWERIYPPEECPRGHRSLASALSNLGFLLQTLADYAASERVHRRALAMRESIYSADEYPEGHASLVSSLNNVAAVLQSQGKLGEAEPYYVRALAMNERLYPENDYPQGHPDLAQSLNHLGYLRHERGELLAARQLHERALQMRERLYPAEDYPRGHDDLTTSLTNLASALEALGDLSEAHIYYRRALEMKERLYPLEEYPDGHPELALALNNLAHLLQLQNDLVGARHYMERAHAINLRLYSAEAGYAVGHPTLATSYSNMGSLLDHQGELAEARQHYELALDMLRRLFPAEQYPDGHAELALGLNNLAYVLEELGQFPEAQRCHEEALAMRRRLFGDAQRFPNGHPEIAASLNNLASVLDAQGRFELAQIMHAEALAMNLRLHPADQFPHGHPELARSYNSLGYTQHNRGLWSEASANYERGLAIYRQLYPHDAYPHGHPDLAAALGNVGSIYAAQGETDAALAAILEADRMLWDGLESLFLASSEATMHAYLGHLSLTDSFVLTLLVSEPALAAKQQEATLAAMRRRTAIVDSLVRLRHAERRAASDADFAQAASRLQELRQRLADQAIRPSADVDPHQLAADINRIEVDMRRQLAGDLGAGKEPTTESIRGRLSSDACLVQLIRFQPVDFRARDGAPFWQAPHYVALVIHAAQESPAVVDLGPADAIERRVSELREHVAKTASELRFADEEELAEEYSDLASDLYELVMAPLNTAIDEVRMIYLVPDGELTRIGWEALVDGDGRYLIDAGYQFAYLSSAADLLRDDPATSTQGTIVFADPDFDLEGRTPETESALAELKAEGEATLASRGPSEIDTRGLNWKRLAATEREAAEIEKLLAASERYGPVREYRGAVAVESILKHIRAPRVLHLATHGFYLADRQPWARAGAALLGDDRGALLTSGAVMSSLRAGGNPLLRSGIVLAGANRVATADENAHDGASQSSDTAGAAAIDDGWVTAEEIGLMNLAGTELVVLSACETGLGDLRIGEGVAGLRRAFLLAGAETIITSLYKVPDVDTQKLMVEFYQRLAAGATKLDALNGAQRAIIAERREENGAAHPFFWASFILVGDPD